MKIRIHALLVILWMIPVFIQAADYEYTLTWLSPNTHTYVVSAAVAPQTDTYTEVKIPAWRPGRYILQDYAAAVSHFEAHDDTGNELKWHKTDKDTWRILHAAVSKVKVSYRYFADNRDAGSSYYAADEIYFNPINLFVYVPGKMDGTVSLDAPDLPKDWAIATALTRTDKHNSFTAKSYHEFADAPTVFAPKMKQLQFQLDETTFYIHFQGKYSGDEATDQAAIETIKGICHEQRAIFGEFPFEEFHFIYRLLPVNYRHAVEHSNSVSFALPARISETPKGLSGGIGSLTSHEFWHAWNVKRIRPAALWPYDYSKPQYTSLHWFTEGVTNYYSHLVLVRAGLETEEAFFKNMSNTLQRLENSYATSIVSPSESSFNSWLSSSPYRIPSHATSYYSLGERVGLFLDLAIRGQTNGSKSLDDVFRYLYQNYFEQDKGIPENGVQMAVEAVTRTSWQDFFNKHVHGVEPIDYDRILSPFGLTVSESEVSNSGKRAIGITSTDDHQQGILVRKLNRGGDAFRDGLAENDLIMEIDDKQATDIDLDDYVNNLKKGKTISMKVFSNYEIKSLSITYQGEFAPRELIITKKKKEKAAATSLMKNWFKSVAK